MAITLDGLTKIIHEARDIVANEPTGFVNGVMLNSNGIERVSLGGTVKSFRTAQPTLNTSYTPAMTPPAGDAQTITTDDLTVGQVANVKIELKGETFRQIENTAGRENVKNALFAQAFRTIRNAIEAHIGTVAKNGASRATGTAGTAPFGTNFNVVNEARQILVDNGCPVDDGQVSLVMSTLAGTNMRNLSSLQRVSEAGSSDLLRRGVLQDISGIALRESSGVATHTKGTLAGSPTSLAAGFAAGATTIGLTAVGTGSIVAGDALSIATVPGVYIVKTGDADVSDGGNIILNAPGLRAATGAVARALTTAASYTANVAFHRSAIELVMRPPAMPEGGDAADDRMTLFDAASGLVFEIALYKGYGMNMIDITVFYQAKVWKSDFVATILG